MEKKLDLETLKHIKLIFSIHSDFSTQCNGYHNLCEIIEKIESKPIEEEQPELVGYLNTAQGFKGFKRSEVGTEVFSYKDKYFINIESLNEGLTMRISYYKETLRPVINFIETKE